MDALWERVGPMRRPLVAALATLLVALGLQAAFPTSASAAITDFKPATFNMQGGSDGVDSKWTTAVQPLLNSGINILALQEAGHRPPGTLLWRRTSWVSNPSHPGQGSVGYTMLAYSWRVGTARNGRTYHIYFLETDPNGHRVNLAIVADRQADGWRTVYGGAGGSGRPALGLRFGDTIFWDVHANANGGSNAATLVANIRSNSGANHWAAMGDWNRDPVALARTAGLPAGAFFYRSFESTQQSGGELDYMVSYDDLPAFGGARLDSLGSDHYPVAFSELRAQSRLGLFSVNDGRYLGLASSSSQRGTKVTVNRTTEDSYGGGWYFDPAPNNTYRIRNVTTNECLELPQADSTAYQWPCDTADSQRFEVGWAANDPTEISLRSYSMRSLCVGQISQGGIDSVPVVLTDCDTQAARWHYRYDQNPDAGAAPIVVFAN